MLQQRPVIHSFVHSIDRLFVCLFDDAVAVDYDEDDDADNTADDGVIQDIDQLLYEYHIRFFILKAVLDVQDSGRISKNGLNPFYVSKILNDHFT